jgi:3-oxo-5-alpha-steroid 4-dehydrogenase 1
LCGRRVYPGVDSSVASLPQNDSIKDFHHSCVRLRRMGNYVRKAILKEQAIYQNLLIGWFILALVIFIVLFRFAAPYGRHIKKGWGPTINSKTGWLVMEAPSPVVFLVCFLTGGGTYTLTEYIFFGLWQAHYVHRSFLYPFTIRGSHRGMPVSVLGSAMLFNAVNGYLNGRYIFAFSSGYPDAYIGDIRFLAGVVLFIIGFIINRQADLTLRNLRRPGESEYRIPYNSLYRWISCPNYLGEIVTWTGWAIMTWSLAGLAFALWTIANLAPRALAHHRWYLRHFDNYPPNRKALVPGLW